jgi:hypothetical protein
MVWIIEKKGKVYSLWVRRPVCLPAADRFTLTFEPKTFIFYQKGKS